MQCLPMQLIGYLINTGYADPITHSSPVAHAFRAAEEAHTVGPKGAQASREEGAAKLKGGSHRTTETFPRRVFLQVSHRYSPSGAYIHAVHKPCHLVVPISQSLLAKYDPYSAACGAPHRRHFPQLLSALCTSYRARTSDAHSAALAARRLAPSSLRPCAVAIAKAEAHADVCLGNARNTPPESKQGRKGGGQGKGVAVAREGEAAVAELLHPALCLHFAAGIAAQGASVLVVSRSRSCRLTIRTPFMSAATATYFLTRARIGNRAATSDQLGAAAYGQDQAIGERWRTAQRR